MANPRAGFKIQSQKGVPVAKPELGEKHDCQECGARFYDLNKSPAVCPKCGTKVAPLTRTKAAPSPKPVKEKAPAKAETDKKGKDTLDSGADEDSDDDIDEDDTLIADDDDGEEVFDPAEGEKK